MDFGEKLRIVRTKKEYTLQYQSEVELSRFLGIPMLKKKP